jgi:hypothetical protein
MVRIAKQIAAIPQSVFLLEIRQKVGQNP